MSGCHAGGDGRYESRDRHRALAGQRTWSCRVEGSWLKSPPAGAWTLLLGSNSGFLLLSRNDPVICQICFHSEHQIIKSVQVPGAVSAPSPWRPRMRTGPGSYRTRSESKQARSGVTGRGCLVQVLSWRVTGRFPACRVKDSWAIYSPLQEPFQPPSCRRRITAPSLLMPQCHRSPERL